jgi:hypothetical protein
MEASKHSLLPFFVVQAAASGDIDAISVVIEHFEGYIAVLATRRLRDEFGNTYMCVDSAMSAELKNRLIIGIIKFKIEPRE